MSKRTKRLEKAAREILRLWDGNELAPHYSADVDEIYAAFEALRASISPSGR